jgi:DNA-binding GntR family transcriptional regulator
LSAREQEASIDDRFDAIEIETALRGSPEAIYEHLRGRILSGALHAGSELTQVQVARAYGVSRGPVREAFRLLQHEGLIEAEVNFRARVTSLSTDEAEHLYAMRIVNECMALAVSLPRLTPDELDELDELVSSLGPDAGLDFIEWEASHERFYALLFAHAGERTRSALELWADYTERYRRVYVAQGNLGWTMGASEHADLARACRAGDVEGATALLAQHLARAGLTLVAIMNPSHQPVLLQAALQQVTAGPRQS